MMGKLSSLLQAKSDGQGQEESGCVVRGHSRCGGIGGSAEQPPRAASGGGSSGRAVLLEERAAVRQACKAPWCGLWRSLLKVGLVESRTPCLSIRLAVIAHSSCCR